MICVNYAVLVHVQRNYILYSKQKL